MGCYSTFFIAQFVLSANGVIAVILLGYRLDTYVDAYLLENVKTDIKVVTEWMTWALHGLLILIIGFYIGFQTTIFDFGTADYFKA